MMKIETVEKFKNLLKVIDIIGRDWWRFEELEKVSKENKLEIPCKSTIRKYYEIEKRIYDNSFERYTRYDGKNLFEMYEDEEEFEKMRWEEKIEKYLVGMMEEEIWKDEYCNEYDYWYDNGTDERVEYKLGKKL